MSKVFISQQNPYPRKGESLDLGDSASCALSKFDILFFAAKLFPLLFTDSSDSVKIYSHELRINFSDPRVAFGVAVVWWRSFRAKNFRIGISFCLTKWCLDAELNWLIHSDMQELMWRYCSNKWDIRNEVDSPGLIRVQQSALVSFDHIKSAVTSNYSFQIL
jgi:hypothetical protein